MFPSSSAEKNTNRHNVANIFFILLFSFAKTLIKVLQPHAMLAFIRKVAIKLSLLWSKSKRNTGATCCKMFPGRKSETPGLHQANLRGGAGTQRHSCTPAACQLHASFPLSHCPGAKHLYNLASSYPLHCPTAPCYQRSPVRTITLLRAAACGSKRRVGRQPIKASPSESSRLPTLVSTGARVCRGCTPELL